MLVWYCIFKAVYFSFISEIGLYPNEPSNVMEYNGEFKLMDVLRLCRGMESKLSPVPFVLCNNLRRQGLSTSTSQREIYAQGERTSEREPH